MIRKLAKESMGRSDLGWLKSRFHFSFAEYRNPKNINFGVLRVLNDDLIAPNSGFEMHPHQDMEIISYIVDGEITHKDSMGNSETLGRGEVQYMSAGDGIYHSEKNLSDSETLRLLQIWVYPPAKSLPRLYGSHRFTEAERKNQLLHILSSQQGDAPIKIHQDVNIFVSEIDKGKTIEYSIRSNRQIYFVLIEGKATVNSVELDFGDACEITECEKLVVDTKTKSHFLFIEMKRG